MINFVLLGQGANRRLKLAVHVSFAIVIVSDCLNLSLLAVSAAYLRQASSLFGIVVASTRVPNFIQDGLGGCIFDSQCQIFKNFNSALDNANQALRFQSGASVCEVFSLSTILISCSIAGVLCIRRFSKKSIDLRSTAGRRNNDVRIRIIGTVSAVFVAFLIRSCFAVILALSRFNNEIKAPPLLQGSVVCDNLCQACQGLGLVVQSWLMLTPECSVTLMLLSSPLTIVISLWGMTSPVFLQKMRKDHLLPLEPAMRGLIPSSSISHSG